MTLKDLRDWVSILPTEFDDYTVINGEFGSFGAGSEYYRLDKPVVLLLVDEEDEEIVILNQKAKEIHNIANGR